MRNLYLLLGLLSACTITQAQPVISIASGTDLNVAAGTIFSPGGLAITPSSAFTLTNVQMNINTTVSHFTANNYISRVYKFSANTAPFSGAIKFYYSDAELNGLTESTLRVNIHDGTSWYAPVTASNDVTNNYVLTTAQTNRVLNELTLSDAFSTLPLTWGTITAYRQAQQVKIQWETLQELNSQHFDVERSVDGQNWIAAISNIPAANAATKHQYSIIDNDFIASRLYYRIRQTDADGRFSYSRITVVNAVSEAGQLLLYPNPVQQVFYINNLSAVTIKEINLYNNNGAWIKTWPTLQSSYNLDGLAAGFYHLRIQLKDGSSQQFTLNKQ